MNVDLRYTDFLPLRILKNRHLEKKKQDALDYHSNGRKGKIEIAPTKPYSSQRDLSLAYSPGVAEPGRDNLEPVLDGMVAPDAAVDVDRLAAKLDVLRKRIVVLVDTSLASRLADA